MTETYTCPADGCEYSGLKDSVLGHYSGKQDDAHSGGYADAKRALNKADGGASADGQESTDSTSTQGGATTPSFPSADGGDSQSSDSGAPECPGCGSNDEVYTADSVLKMYQRHAGVELTPEHRKALREADAGCVGCGTAFTVEES